MWTNFDIFGRNVTDKVSRQKTLYYATSNNLCFCTTWQKGETWKLHLSFKFVHCPNSTSCSIYFLQSFWLTTYTHAGVWLSKSCNQCVQLWAVGAWLRINKVESTAEVGLCYPHNAPVCCLLGFLLCKVMLKHYTVSKKVLTFLQCAAINARIASAVLVIALPSVCLSACSSVTRRYCVKMTACSTVQFALSDSKMCLVL